MISQPLDSDEVFRTELRRTVDRLRSTPVTRLAAAVAPTYAALDTLAGEEVPRLAPHALGDQLQVVADEAATAASFDFEAGADLLLELRRALP